MFSCNSDPHFNMESRSFTANLDFSSSSFFPFSPAFNQDGTFHDLLLPQVAYGANHSPLAAPTALAPIKEVVPAPKTISAAIGHKRGTRKDRHSKIVTAQGPRDRRMRLNLEVAPQFFDIQDMLGYDKASKTIQWLMEEAKDSIEKLKAATGLKEHSLSVGGSPKSTEASTLELDCEDISVVSDYKGKSPVSQQEKVSPKAKRVGRRPSRRAAYPSSLARESRAMARARARERTRVKKLGDGCSEWNEYLSSSIPFEAIEEGSGSYDHKSSLDIVAEVEEQCSPSTNQCKQFSNVGRVNEFSVSILDVCPNNMVSMFPPEPEAWVDHFASIEDDQMHTRLWYAYAATT